MSEASKHSILIVDDEADILYSLRALFRREFDVHTAESGAQAMEILHRQPIHVVMTDQRMPGMSGVELLSRIQGEHSQAIRIIFTGYADLKSVIDAINRGHVYRYLTKPWDPDELQTLLRQACEQYDRIIERQRLLTDLRGHVAQGLTFVQGQTEAEQFVQAGNALLARLERALAT